jgi:Tol biopolymer transport system component
MRAVVTVESGDKDVVRASLVDPDAPPEPLIQTNRIEERAEYCPTGDRISFLSNRSGQQAIWISDSTGAAAREIWKVVGISPAPKWAPDGRHLAFMQHTDEANNVFVVDSESGGSPRLLTQGRRPVWSRDGASIYYRSGIEAETKTGTTSIWRIRAEGGVAERVIDFETRGQGDTIESPDRRVLYAGVGRNLAAFTLDENGRASEKPTLVAEDITGFSVLDSGVYYCTANDEVKHYDPISRQTKTVRSLDDDAGQGCSVSPDGSWLIYTRRIRTGHDLMLLEAAP